MVTTVTLAKFTTLRCFPFSLEMIMITNKISKFSRYRINVHLHACIQMQDNDMRKNGRG